MTVAVDGEDDWQPLPRVRAHVRTILNPIDKIRGFRRKADTQKRVNRKGRVAQPGIAIIPIARATDHFGKTGRGSCDDRPRRFKRQQLEHERGSLYQFTPTAPVSAARDPVLPEFHRTLKQLFGLLRRRRTEGSRIRVIISQSEDLRLAFLDHEIGANSALAVLR